MLPQLQSTCHYIVNSHVKIWHVGLGGANNMCPTKLGTQTEKILNFVHFETNFEVANCVVHLFMQNFFA